jgi:UDP-2,4-diacetamido-2,4,6-trideoxy-beta-L-altropyranose hydrolase
VSVVFRVDSSYDIGSGHVMRCLSLAKHLKKYYDINFVCRDTEGNIIELIQKQGYQVIELSKINNLNIVDWVKENWELDVNETISAIEKLSYIKLFVIDHYGIDSKWEMKIRSKTKKIMVIDDLANRIHSCDIILDQNYFKGFEMRYDELVPSHCRKLLGPNNILLRDEFFQLKKRERSGEIKSVLVFFGGSDPTNETLKVLSVLLNFNQNNLLVKVIVGTSNYSKEQIKSLCQKQPNFSYYHQVENMAELMNDVDLIIGAGGTTTWERCFLGVPSITIAVANNQVEVSKAVSELGATIYLGLSEVVSPNEISATLVGLLNNPIKVRTLSINTNKILDKMVVSNQLVIKNIMEEII